MSSSSSSMSSVNAQPGPALSSAAGIPVVDNTHSLTAGPLGPMLLQDVWFLEKQAHFDREVIAERRVHAKGSGAFGTFTVSADITRYTRAKLFEKVGKQTSVFVRFSTVAGERGSADAVRDVRGFSVKFYTEEGNWDLAGNNSPVFFVRDPLKFVDLNRAAKRDPSTNLHRAGQVWDFWTSMPESFHQVTILMSERGIPASYRHMHGFGCHTFSLINAAGERVWCKFHLKTQQGIKNFTNEQAAAAIAHDADTHQRDLYEAIAKGQFPRWTFQVQIMTEKEVDNVPFNPFDLTKVWPHKQFPLITVGTLELNKNPENYFQDVEQAAFNPANVPPGIGFSPDKVLQGRLFAYGDAQRYRLGVNHHQIPVNRPNGLPPAMCPFASFHRDGLMRVDGNAAGKAVHEPNSRGQWTAHKDLHYHEPALKLDGAADRFSFKCDAADYYGQTRAFLRIMSNAQKQTLYENTARALADAPKQFKDKHLLHCAECEDEYGKGVKAALDKLSDADAVANSNAQK